MMMRKFFLFVLLLASAACKNDDSTRKEYITPEINFITVGANGSHETISVRSNCVWRITDAPSWCNVQKTGTVEQGQLDLEVFPNELESVPDGIVYLSSKFAVGSLHIFQQGKKETIDPLQWTPFAVNSLTDAIYESGADGIARDYRITGERLFAMPHFGREVYLGHLISPETNNQTLKTFDRYRYNPIRFSASVGGKFYEDEARPSFDAVKRMADRIIAELPEESNRFYYSSPIRYYSYRHLHLLGFGNLGLNLDEEVSGKPYTRQEMTRRTGMIYTCSQELFSLIMDYPEKLIDEPVAEQDLVYINSIAYGKAALMLVESDYAFEDVKRVVSQIAAGETLSGKDATIREDLDCWHIAFGSKEHSILRGDYRLIREGIDRINSLSQEIVPLNFSVNKLKDNSVGAMTVSFELQ